MTLSGKQMRVLEAQSTSFGEDHKTPIAQAIDAVRSTGDPRQAVRLLTVLSGKARPRQKAALVEVRRWIEGRLRKEPKVSAERVMLELGWLRRLSVARQAGLVVDSRGE